MPLTQTQLLAFNAITGFVKDLSSEFGQHQHSLALYARLIAHMNLSQEGAIKKVVDGFTTFINLNKIAIETREEGKLSNDKIVYSEKIFLQLSPLFKASTTDKQTKDAMWRHILTIYGLLYPESQAKDILREIRSGAGKNRGKSENENELISDMVQKIVPHLNADDTPMQAIMGLMSSGVFTELIGTMQKGMDGGNIDMGSLMNQVSTMFAQPDPTAKLAKPN